MDDSEPHRIDALMQRPAPRGSPKGRDARFVYTWLGWHLGCGGQPFLYMPSSSNSRTSDSSRLTATMPLPQQLYQ